MGKKQTKTRRKIYKKGGTAYLTNLFGSAKNNVSGAATNKLRNTAGAVKNGVSGAAIPNTNNRQNKNIN